MRLSLSPPAALAAAGLAVCLAAAPARAQVPFALDEPALVVGGERVAVRGAPLHAERFERFTLTVPGVAAYEVSDRPFAGARKAGQFDGDGLYFATEGVSVRLGSRVPILGGARRDAYVRITPAPGEGPARVAITAGPRGEAEETGARGPQPGALPEPDGPLRDEIRRLGAERDAAHAERDEAIAERDAARAQTAALREEAASGEADEVQRLRTAVDALTEQLAETRAERDRLAAALDSAQADRDALRTRLDALTADGTALRVERDALRTEVAILRERTAPRPDVASGVPPQPPSDAIPTRTSAAPEASVEIVGFDFGRVANPGAVRALLSAVELPPTARAEGLAGDVLVLFQTDAEGRVIRTAVPRPLGSGLDALAESVVREMRFVPPLADGRPTGLRSQVVVRFGAR